MQLARFVGLGALLCALAACSDRRAQQTDGDGDAGADEGVDDGVDPSQEWHTIAVSENDDLDVLLVLDDSVSMAEEQTALAANLAVFVEILERPEIHKNYRIGITTTDDGNPLCSSEDRGGALQLRSCRSHLDDFVVEGTEPLDATEACTAACPEQWTNIETLPTTTAYDEVPRSRDWIERLGGATNLPEGLSAAQAIQCIAPQGITGCEFESPLESMWMALERSEDETDAGFDFIRELATLMVVFVTDEDDCSYNRAWESIFLPEGNRVFWSDQDAPAASSAVCWNAGVACTGAGTYDECHAVDLDVNGDPVGGADAAELAVLHPVSRYVGRLQELEDRKREWSPSQEVLVSVVGGVSPDGSVIYQDAIDDPEFQRDFGIGPGCESEMGRAVPPVRLRELGEAFAVEGWSSMASICQSDYGSVFEPVAETLIDHVDPACMPICVGDADPSTVVVDPSCELRQVPPDVAGAPATVAVPRCGPGGVLPGASDVCYQPLVGEERDEFCVDLGFNLQFQLVRREGAYVAPGTEIQARCEPSEDPSHDCPSLP